MFMSLNGKSSSSQDVHSLLVQARTQIVKYLPRHLDADKMIYVALETARADSFLRQCEPLSIVQAVLEASQLVPQCGIGNKLGHAYLAPRRDKKANNILKCQLLIGYRGFIALAHRTGKEACQPETRTAKETERQSMRSVSLNAQPTAEAPWSAVRQPTERRRRLRAACKGADSSAFGRPLHFEVVR
jgi:phage RecT family recombinase